MRVKVKPLRGDIVSDYYCLEVSNDKGLYFTLKIPCNYYSEICRELTGEPDHHLSGKIKNFFQLLADKFNLSKGEENDY